MHQQRAARGDQDVVAASAVQPKGGRPRLQQVVFRPAALRSRPGDARDAQIAGVEQELRHAGLGGRGDEDRDAAVDLDRGDVRDIGQRGRGLVRDGRKMHQPPSGVMVITLIPSSAPPAKTKARPSTTTTSSAVTDAKRVPPSSRT